MDVITRISPKKRWDNAIEAIGKGLHSARGKMSTSTANLSKKSPSFTSYISSSGSSGSLNNSGITNPLHWDNLSEEVRKQLEKGPLTGSMASNDAESVSGSLDTSLGEKKKRRHSLIQPDGTFDHTVGPRDTLVSIAARFDTTPSFLKKLNHLTSQLIFPGQVLYIPNKDYTAVESPHSPPPDQTTPKCTNDEPDNQSLSPRSSLHPGHAERLGSANSEDGRSSPKEIEPPKPLSEEEAKKLDQECYERFIKVNVKHITDGMGVVSGVLLVTPNAVMFDPDVMDRLVAEHGADTYGMIAPMEMIMSAALYHDIAAMKVKGLAEDETVAQQKSAVYHGEDLGHSNPSSPTNEQQPSSLVGFQLEPVKESEPCSEDDVATENTKNTDIETSDEGILINFDAQIAAAAGLPSDPIIDKQDLVSVGSCDKFPLEEGSLKSTYENNACLAGAQNPSVNWLAKGRQESFDIAVQTDCLPVAVVSSPIQTNNLPVGVSSPVPSDKRPTQLDVSAVAQTDISNASLQPGAPNMQGFSPHMQIGSITYFQYDKPAESPSGDTGSTSTVVGESIQAEDVVLKKTVSSASWVDLPHVPSLKNFVDFSSGLFSSRQEEVGKVKDINEHPQLERHPSATWYSDSTESDTSSTKSGKKKISKKDSKKESKKDSKKSSKTNKGKKLSEIPVEVVSLVRPADMPALFQTPADLVPSPALQYEDPPLFLCLKVGMPVNKRVSKTCPIESYNKKKKKPEYWFSIPRDKVDHLYAFFVQWSPNIYGSEADIDPKARGFVVLEDDDEDGLFNLEGSNKKLTRQMSKDWEIVNVEEARRRLSLLDVEDALPLPELRQPSVILNESHIRHLSKSLPARAEGYPWSLIYSTEKNGFSLKTLYRNMQDCDTPVLFVVKDTFGNVFGAMTSCELILSDHFYGNGESFLFTFMDDFMAYHWSGENSFFIRGSKESLAFGAGEGSFGLWLDSDFYHGRTKTCQTYENPPLTEQEDFFIAAIEAWGFFSD